MFAVSQFHLGLPQKVGADPRVRPENRTDIYVGPCK